MSAKEKVSWWAEWQKGLIASAATAVVAVFLSFVPSIRAWGLPKLTQLWAWVVSPVPVPHWLFFFVALALGFLALKAFRSLVTRNIAPDFEKYTSDVFEGIVWYWKYSRNDLVTETLTPRCANDSSLLVYHQDYHGSREMTEFICEQCGWRSSPLAGDVSAVRRYVARRIDQKLVSGDWMKKQHE